LCDRRWGWERSGTHMGAGQPSGGEVGRDARGPDVRAAARSGGQPSGGEVGGRAVRSWLDLAGCAGGCVNTKHCPSKY
jgi:hypothetical protein